jgi:hypothetical protein
MIIPETFFFAAYGARDVGKGREAFKGARKALEVLVLRILDLYIARNNQGSGK